MSRLDDRARALAEVHAPWAIGLARYHGRSYGSGLREDCQSGALWGLTLAAARFDPARAVPFKSFARPAVVGAIHDELRRRAAWRRRDARLDPSVDPALVPGREPLPGSAAAVAEVLDGWLDRLPPGDAAACRALVAAAGRPREAARSLGITNRELRRRRLRAARTLRHRRQELAPCSS